MSDFNKLFEPAVPYGISQTDIMSMINFIRKGISFNSFMSLVNRTGFNLSDWAKFMHISERSIQRYRQEKRKFDPLQSERILEIALLYKKGIEVFGSDEKFRLWLHTNCIALGNVKPVELFDNSFGIGLLQDELGRIDHGIFA